MKLVIYERNKREIDEMRRIMNPNPLPPAPAPAPLSAPLPCLCPDVALRPLFFVPASFSSSSSLSSSLPLLSSLSSSLCPPVLSVSDK